MKTRYFVAYSFRTMDQWGSGRCFFSVDGRNAPLVLVDAEKEMKAAQGFTVCSISGFKQVTEKFWRANK